MKVLPLGRTVKYLTCLLSVLLKMEMNSSAVYDSFWAVQEMIAFLIHRVVHRNAFNGAKENESCSTSANVSIRLS